MNDLKIICTKINLSFNFIFSPQNTVKYLSRLWPKEKVTVIFPYHIGFDIFSIMLKETQIDDVWV